MTRRVCTIAATVVAALSVSTAAAGQDSRSATVPGKTPGREPPPVEVLTSLTRTAVWIGDPVVYTVELRYARPVDILMDDLAGGQLRVDGGEVVGVEEEQETTDGRSVRRVRYTLATYRVDATELRIAAMPVRYYARAGGVGAAQAPGEVTVPSAVVAVRSTIPDRDGVAALRVPATLRPAPRHLRLAQPAGLILIAIALVPAAIWGLDAAAWARRGWTRYRAGRQRQQPRASLEALKSIEVLSDSERIRAYGQLDAIVRDHLQLTTGITAHALTPEEVRRALEHRAPSLPHHDIEALLAACERARYAAQPPAADHWPDALRDAEHILAARR